MSFLFWEFFNPFNRIGDAIALIELEVVFWALIAIAEGFIIATIMERVTSKKRVGTLQ